MRRLGSICALLLLPATSAMALTFRHEHQLLVREIYVDKPNDPDAELVDKQLLHNAYVQESGGIDFSPRVKSDYSFYMAGLKLKTRDDIDRLGLLYFDPRHRTTLLDYYPVNQSEQIAFLRTEHLALRLKLGRLRVSLGRSPIELSKGFIFRPNDLFGPASYHPLDPMLKTGVDHGQLSGALAPLGEWKLIGVLGYKEQRAAAISEEGPFIPPKNSYDSKMNAILISVMNTWFGYGIQGIAGIYRNTYVLLANLEGQITPSLGLRSEFKQNQDRDTDARAFSMMTGLDYKFHEKHTIYSEFYANGQGFDHIKDIQKAEASPYKPLAQLGRYYLGAGLSSELTPLLMLKSLAEYNFSDHSSAVSLSLNYSVSSQIDIRTVLLYPHGTAPKSGKFRSEFGAYPSAAVLEATARW